MSLQDHLDFVNATLSAYFVKEGKLELQNELTRLTYEFWSMAQANKIEFQGGQNAKFDVMLDNDEVGDFVGEYEERSAIDRTHTREGTIPWSFFEGSWLISDQQMKLNGGLPKIFDLVQVKEAGMKTGCANKLEKVFWDSMGNAAYWTTDKRRPPGLKYWATRDGRNVNEGATNEQLVGGINPRTVTNWRSRYIGPLGSNLNATMADDTTDKLTQANQLLRVMSKICRYTSFTSPTGMDIKFLQDDKAKERSRWQRIYADEIGQDALELLLESKNESDNMANREIASSGEPVYRGVPIKFCELLGLDSSGTTADMAHDYGGGNIQSGKYANTGEIVVLNMANFKIVAHEETFPERMKLEWLAKQQAAWQLYKWWFSVVCNARRRIALAWGFGRLKAA